MPDVPDPTGRPCETASELKEILLEQIGEQIELDEATMDAIAEAIMSLLKSASKSLATD